MENEIIKPHLNQIAYIRELIKDSRYIQEHFILKDVWATLRKGLVSEDYYKFVLALILEENYKKLNEVLPQIGFNTKI